MVPQTVGNYTISVDPGVHSLGVAVFHKQRLLVATFVEAEQWLLASQITLDKGDTVICEQMQAYAPGLQKGDQADILHVNLTVGAIMEHARREGATCELIYPRVWKGNVPKEVMLNRIMSKLMEEEKALLPNLPKTKLHNVIDAIGIGLWKLGRL